MPGRTLVHFDSLRICYDADWRAGRTHTAAGRKSRGSMIAESAVVLSMRVLNNTRNRISDERQARPGTPGPWILALGGGCFFEGWRDAAKSSLWCEVALLGGLLQTIVSQAFSGG